MGATQAHAQEGDAASPGTLTPTRSQGEGEDPASASPDAEPSLGTTVTATRLPRPARDVPGTVTVLPREELERSPTLTTDALLRTLPSVATFRRNSSLVSDPSAQGLNLRGVGPSGVSRSLVLLDGVPVNDPFGGWVYWRALPRLGLQRIEVAPGGGSALYGSSAMGGVVQLVSRPLTESTLDGELSVGRFGTGFLAARATGRLGKVGLGVETEGLTSQGYPVVAPSQRGAVDSDAGGTHTTLNAQLEAPASQALTLNARAGFFQERQDGGTQYTNARVRVGTWGGGAKLDTGGAGQLALQLFGHVQRFEQERARLAPGRASESLSAEQRVPTDDEGVSLVWTAPAAQLGGTHEVAAGLDLRRIAGHSEETLLPPGSAPDATVARDAGGTQLFGGVFLQDLYAPTERVQLSAALRVDSWRNLQGERTLTTRAGDSAHTAFEDRGESQLSPRVGVLVHVAEPLRLRASAYRAFRAPTLNELYRPFQVGTVLTAANDALRAERLVGAEAGAELQPLALLTLRATGFWNRLEDPITNVTLAEPLPDGSTRQRQNLGAARVQGVELGAEARFLRVWTALAAYTFVDSRVLEAPGNEALVGKELPQDPRHRATLQLAFDDPRLVTATAQLRVTGPQFEDDLNESGMGGVALVDLSLGRRLYRGLELFGAVENLFDREYLVGRAGVDTVGAPRMFRLGLRWRSGR
nr:MULTISPECIES: TonB-dependent receptor [Myxococcaceae]